MDLHAPVAGPACSPFGGAVDVACCSPPPSGQGGAAPGESVALSAAPILVVDDDADIRDTLALVLEDEGYRVHTAANGREALGLLEEIGRPALALVDLRMPVMDGVELIEAMRNDPRWRDIPVIVLSAASTIAAPDGVPVLRKPVGIMTLLDAVRTHASGG